MTITTSIDHLLTNTSAPLDGFIVDERLREIGVSKRHAQSCRMRGRLHRIIGSVWHVSLRRDQLTPRQWMRARLLAAGHDATLTRLAALEVSGGSRFRCGGHLHILVPTRRHIELPDATIHVVPDLRPEDVRYVDRMRITTDEWTCAELGRDFTGSVAPYQIANAMHSIEYRDRSVDLADRVAGELSRRRHIGSPIVGAAVKLYKSRSSGTRGRTEDRYLEMALTSYARRPLVNTVHDVLGRTVEVDFLYVDERVRVEVKGDQHGRIHDSAVDHVRDIDFEASGIAVVNEDWNSVWHDLDGCRSRLLQALRRAE